MPDIGSLICTLLVSDEAPLRLYLVVDLCWERCDHFNRFTDWL